MPLDIANKRGLTPGMLVLPLLLLAAPAPARAAQIAVAAHIAFADFVALNAAPASSVRLQIANGVVIVE